MRSTAAVLLLVVLSACSSSPRVTTQQDWSTDFAQYRTYAWSQATESRIRDAVDLELRFKGLQKVEPSGSPDLHVSSYASAEEALVIDLVDARSGRLVWRGLAPRTADHPASDAALRQVVREIFRHYPRIG